MMQGSRVRKKLLFSGNYTPQLPLWKKVIFVDWHGVMSSDVFWHSILSRSAHPAHTVVKRATTSLFRDERVVTSWMKGRLTSRQIVDQIDLHHLTRYDATYLLRKLHRDCRTMEVDQRLLGELRGLATSHFVVLATDNMDCFASEIGRLEAVQSTFDAVLCSSEIGTLKSSVEEFFGPWLSAHNLYFSDAILVDDSRENCSRFLSAGGHTINHTSSIDTIVELRRWAQYAK